MSAESASPVLGKLSSLRCLTISMDGDQRPHKLYYTKLTALTELCLSCGPNARPSTAMVDMSSLRTLRFLSPSEILCFRNEDPKASEP